MKKNNISTSKIESSTKENGSTWLSISIAAYFLYALFLLIECLDFSALLHSPEPGYHATYDMNSVIFYVLDLIICVTLGLVLTVLYFAPGKKPNTVVLAVLLITLLRGCLIYYLYMFKEGSYQITPFIYKEANGFSVFVRTTLLPLQILAGIGCIWSWVRIASKQPLLDN
ncbi:hypothetical protein [Mucilaginibacter polytrichastri]|uniref:Uncharacterized protein n=1 Tax=Mucilaginibacter polytrichastri TaxID=1302689 RepID=A0A1Q6A0B8_9SPHI|nr:hypothetical protein [Mucilaginibacter polytrichastri]OKS87460.1 hypothetical protein RG47T_2921 [Mucilaginibacter polytrichastri]SFS90907.1 hypothetical protein SAMN04487890_10655 [Mucilaginibacter polytrichastri]